MAHFAYLQAGSAARPLVLCLHGFPDHAPSMLPLMERLAAAGWHSVAPWMRGYHPSVLDGPYHPDQIAEDVLAIGDVLSPAAPYALIGHVWGAIATYRACALRPERISAAITLAVPYPSTFLKNAMLDLQQQRRSWYIGLFQRKASEGELAANDFALLDRLWRTWSPSYQLPAEARRALIECFSKSMPAPIEYYRALLRPVSGAIGRLRQTAAATISVPTLYLHGADDGCIGPGIAKGQEEHFSGGFRSEVVPGAGHFLQLERPDLVASRAIDWLEAHRGSRSVIL